MLYETFKTWIDTFETAVATDDWDAAARMMADDVRYIVAGSPYACDLRGKTSVLDGFRHSLTNFDAKFEDREWRVGNIRLFEPSCVMGTVIGTYTKAGLPPLRFGVEAQWFFQDGKVSLMTDLYDLSTADVSDALGWIGEHGGPLGLDASYVPLSV